MTISNRPEPLSAAVESSVPGLGAADIVGISLLGMALLLVAYFRARHRMFWGDEIMGWIVLRQPNFQALLQAWRFGIDSSGIWFYVVGRVWMSLFGTSELTLRLFSATGIAASAAVVWLAARRYYSVLPVAAGVTFVYSVLAPLRWQLVNGRTYGVFLFAAAVVFYLLLRGEDPRLRSPHVLFLLATFAAYSLLAGSHILGSIYVGAFLGMQLALDLYARRFRPLLYLSALCSLVVVWFSRANIASTAALGKPTFWTQRPVFKQLLTQSVLFGHRLAAAIALVLLITLLHLHFARKRSPVYVILLGFAALDLAIFTLSRVTTSIYFDRYVLPFAFAAVLLLAEIFTQLREADAPWLRLRIAFPMLYLLAACAALTVHRLQQLALPADNYTGRLLAQLPPGLPVVDADAATFVELRVLSP